MIIMRNEYRNLVIPILQKYEVASENSFWELSQETRILYNDEVAPFSSRLKEIKQIIFYEDHYSYLSLLQTVSDDRKKTDITINLVDTAEVTQLSNHSESYRIIINEEGVEIYVSSIETLLHVFNTLKQLLNQLNRTLLHGEIIDFPDMDERRLHIDMGRKYFTKNWLIQQIRKLSELKMNTLQLHFSENKGFRIESEFAPEIVSEDGYLTKKEVQAVLIEAKKYGIQIIPSLDTPGHVEHILRFYPEFGQVGIEGERSKVALDITNSEAIRFIKSLYSEYMELFNTSSIFHIGGDEYMEFDRAPFTTIYKPVLNEYAVNTWGEGYNWKDVVADYINQIAAHVYQHGFTPRIWNDGVYYDEEEVYEAKQKIALHSYIAVDFWSQMGWNPSVATLNTLLNRGFRKVYNVNASYFYYVLRPDTPTDGRPSHSFDFLNQDRRIFEEWHPGLFESNVIASDDYRIGGASLAVWCDVPNLVSEDIVATDISKELISFATKTWNKNSNRIVPYDSFIKI